MDDCFVPIGCILKLLQELQEQPRYQELDIGANFIHDVSVEIQSKILDHQVADLFTAPPLRVGSEEVGKVE